MKKLIVFSFFLLSISALAQDLTYYLPDSVSYNPAIPKPKDVIFHEVGEYHVTHDRLVAYMKAIATAAPDRVRLENMGFTYEQRPQVLLIITSPKNHQNLEQIRQQHLQLTDPAKSGNVQLQNMPAVVWIGHSIHGNEPSGANAALVSAYYLAAGQGKNMDELLENTVILFDPSFNPDGLQRFSTWVNQHKSKNLVTDPNSREFNEVWPGGRFNHYWFDLNRDWLPAVHVESQNRLKWFHLWKPNVLTDHHEQGSNATFFFQPGVPSRVHPLTPKINQEMTGKIGNYHAKYLDRIGSLYFTKENYDDFYYGKGSTYPDINGAVGILFEQASSRGHAQQTSNGVLRFPFTIRNQFVTTLSTLEAVRNLRTELLSMQRDFYRNAISESATAPVKGYVFGDEKDAGKTNIFLTMLQRHQIDVHVLNNNLKVEGNDFKKGAAYVIPANQPQHRLIRAIFEKQSKYEDSLFYDITTWTMPLAFGLPYAELSAAQYNTNLLGERYTPAAKQKFTLPRSNNAYVLEWTEYFAPAALYELQSSGIVTRIATNTFELPVHTGLRKFGYGTVTIPIQMQNVSSERIYEVVSRISEKYELPFYAVTTSGVNAGSDLGSSRFAVASRPVVAMITGPGVNALDAGEFWHLMDQRFNIPVSHLEPTTVNRIDLGRYNTIVLVGGNYSEINKDKLRSWVQGGGNLIVMEEAVNWAAQSGISTVTFKRAKTAIDTTQLLPYISKEQIEGSQQVRGAIFKAEVDLTHPLAYGYSKSSVSMFKGNRIFMERSRNPFATPFFYKSEPLQSGWISRQNLDAVRNSAAVVVNGLGSGKVISIADNPNFRAFWLGGSKLMMNAIFFGRMIDTNFTGAE